MDESVDEFARISARWTQSARIKLTHAKFCAGDAELWKKKLKHFQKVVENATLETWKGGGGNGTKFQRNWTTENEESKELAVNSLAQNPTWAVGGNCISGEARNRTVQIPPRFEYVQLIQSTINSYYK